MRKGNKQHKNWSSQIVKEKERIVNITTAWDRNMQTEYHFVITKTTREKD